MGLAQDRKKRAEGAVSHTSPTKAIFTQNDNKTQGMSSHLRFMIQAHEFLWRNFGSRGLEGQEVCSIKLKQFKVDKRNMLLTWRVFSNSLNSNESMCSK